MICTSRDPAQMPDRPGTFWFTGTVTVPGRPLGPTAPGNTTTVHVDRPRRFEPFGKLRPGVVQTQFGLIPVEPSNFYPYALCTFDGVWEGGR